MTVCIPTSESLDDRGVNKITPPGVLLKDSSIELQKNNVFLGTLDKKFLYSIRVLFKSE